MVNLPKFKDKKLWDLAFVHRSYLNEIGKKDTTLSNERLEFLGDSVIAFLTSEFLFNKFPQLPEGKLTNLRSFLVKKDTLAEIARELDLGSFLKLSKGEQDANGRNNPSLLANSFEALVGAMFLDSGIEKVKTFLEKSLFPKIDKEGKTLPLTFFQDNKSSFQELVQSDKLPTPVYKVLKTEGPDHRKTFTVGVYVKGKIVGSGKGNSKQAAEQEAAKVALTSFKR